MASSAGATAQGTAAAEGNARGGGGWNAEWKERVWLLDVEAGPDAAAGDWAAVWFAMGCCRRGGRWWTRETGTGGGPL